MSRESVMPRGVLLLAAAALMVACEPDNNLVGVSPEDSLFRSYVAIGNSITAGYQSGGINETTQSEAYPRLLATQMHTQYADPALSLPGCPPPIVNFQTQTRLTLPGQPPSTDQTCALRDSSRATTTLNNVAVPGIKAEDPAAVVGPDQNALTQLILGGRTMVRRALDARPTFATVWVGNNDVLEPAIMGGPAGATPLDAFAQSYARMLAELLEGAPGVKGVLIGVIQVANAPVLFTARALQSPAFVAELSLLAGMPISVDPTSCTPTTTSLIALPLLAQVREGVHPPVIACAPTATPPIGDAFVLDSAERAQVAAIVDGYNAYIRAKADSIGFAYFDPNVTFAELRQIDPVLQTRVPDLASPTATFGQFVTLDGIHPSAAAHVRIANALIAIINAKYGTHLVALPAS